MRKGSSDIFCSCCALLLSHCYHTHRCMLLLPQARASERQRGSATVHGPGDYWRVMRQASELAAMGGWLASSWSMEALQQTPMGQMTVSQAVTQLGKVCQPGLVLVSLSCLPGA